VSGTFCPDLLMPADQLSASRQRWELGVDVEQVEDVADRVVDQVQDRLGPDVERRHRRGDHRATARQWQSSLGVSGHGKLNPLQQNLPLAGRTR
jgi:hypothetical protein